MNKIIKKIIVPVMIVCTLFTSAFTSGSVARGVDQKSASSGFGATSTVADCNILENSVSDYKIVVPQSADAESKERFAASELNTLFFEATKFNLPVITDEGLTHTTDGKYISIGKTELLKTSGVEQDKTLTYNGYQLVTKDETIYCFGTTSNGAVNAVYQFLYLTLNFEQFTYTVYTLDKNVTEIPLYDFNEKDMPDVTYQEFALEYAYEDVQYRQRMHMNYKKDIYLYPNPEIRDNWIHNTFNWFPLSVYGQDGSNPRPNIYGANEQQLCYKANNSPTDLEFMYQTVLETSKQLILEKPDNRIIGFTHEDIDIWCNCSQCSAATSKYGTGAGVVIQFLNECARRLRAWVQTVPEIADNEYQYMFFAYNPTVGAPARKNANGTYSAIDSSVVCDPWVSVMIAPILSDQYVPYNEGKNVEQYWSGLEGWAACCSNINYWAYNYSFVANIAPFTVENSRQQTKRLFLEKGMDLSFEEFMMDYRNTGFHEWVIYCQTKLNWDVNLDQAALREKFFKAVYGDGAQTMLKLYDTIRVNLHTKYVKGTISGSCWEGEKLDRADAWPLAEVLYYKEQTDKALKEIEPLKNIDPDKYQITKDSTVLESLFPRYCLIQFYGGKYTDADLYEMKYSFKSDANNLSVTRYNGYGYITSLYDSWGV